MRDPALYSDSAVPNVVRLSMPEAVMRSDEKRVVIKNRTTRREDEPSLGIVVPECFDTGREHRTLDLPERIGSAII